MDAFEISGQWSEPDKENTVGGILSFSPDKGLRLNLIGATSDSIEMYFGMKSDPGYPIILGITTTGVDVTLIDCQIANTTISSSGYPTQILRPRMAFVGYRFNSIDEISADTLIAQYTYLPEWFEKSGFSWKWPSSSQVDNDPFIITYTNPGEAFADILGASVRVYASIRAKFSRFSPQLWQSVSVQFNSKKHLSVTDWLEEYVIPFQDLLTLATDRPNAVSDIKIVVKIEKTATDDQREKRVGVFFEPTFHDNSDKAELSPQDLLFGLNDISDFNNTMSLWMEKQALFKTALNIYFGAQYNPSKYLDARFLLTIQTIEIYYRSKMSVETPRLELPRSSIRVALEALFDEAQDVMLPLVKNRKRFITNVVNSRNYYTHYEASLLPKASQEGELYWLNEALLILLRRSLLQELGFSSEQCIALFNRNKTYTSARSLGDFS